MEMHSTWSFFVFSNGVENKWAEIWGLFGVEAHPSQDLTGVQRCGISLSWAQSSSSSWAGELFVKKKPKKPSALC